MYTGYDCVVKFVKNVLLCEELLVNTIKFNQYMEFGKKEKIYHENSKVCYICNNNRGFKSKPETPFTSSDPKVRDHDHLTGKYLGPAHQSCNLNKRREKPFLSIFFHNFSGYDSHLILPFLSKSYLPEVESVSIIPKSTEKFMSIKINNRVTMLDSMNFLAGGLEKLFESVKDSCSFSFIKQSSLISDFDIENTERIPKENAKERLELLLGKGVFPYEFANSIEDFSHPKLIEKKYFYNTMSRSNITDVQYDKAKNVWKAFNMCSMREYMETYCLCDTLLLCEVFERFKRQSMENFEIEPGHFLSLPGFAYQAFLKHSGVQMDYITTPELFEMLSSNLRGGHSFTSQRYEESTIFKDFALNTNMMTGEEETDNLREKQHIIDIDMNNLYGCAQSFKIPKEDFRFLSVDEKKQIDWYNLNPNDNVGFFVEVDLVYPKEIHERTKSFPLCPQNIEITYNMLSPFQKQCLQNLSGKENYRQKKLTATFLPKQKIILHGLLLSLYLKLGMKLVKVHRCVRFKQESFLREWVDFCTCKRSNSEDAFGKKFWKDMVNIVFGMWGCHFLIIH